MKSKDNQEKSTNPNYKSSNNVQVDLLHLFCWILIYSFYLTSFIYSPVINDDAVNIKLLQALVTGETNLLDHIKFYTLAWIEAQGRFFPGAVAYGSFLYSFLSVEIYYKLVISFIPIGLALITYKILNRFVKIENFIPFFAIILLSLQFRWSTTVTWDGITGFTGLPLLSLAIYSGSLILLFKSTKYKILSIFVTYFAFVTYETVVIIAFPVLFYLLKYYKSEFKIHSVPFLITLISIFYFRSQRKGNDWAYQIDLDLGKFLEMTISQLISALPGGIIWGNMTTFSEGLSYQKTAIWLLLIYLPTYIIISGQKLIVKESRIQYRIILIALWVIVSSTFLTSLIPRWQETLPFAQTYISSSYSFFGTGLLLYATNNLIISYIANQSTNKYSQVKLEIFSILFSFIISVNYLFHVIIIK